MIYEMRTVTFKPGSMSEVLSVNQQTHRIFSPKYGETLGLWTVEIGALNRLWRLCAYDSHEDYRQKREGLSKDARWQNEHLSKVSQHLVQHETRILTPVMPVQAPEAAGNIYEYRYYRTAPGQASRYASQMERAASIRKKHVCDVGMWIAESGQPDEFSHMVAHPSMEARTSQRAAMAADAGWADIQSEIAPLLVDARSEILVPLAWSKMR